ncbi:HNH endonuclease family protein [Endozoicomonas sp. ALB032]|uniref:HNH endonuclease family protein n=1 Tax=Endozoicomonas sp. ALB032 TaxID=3403082 RepID=UPI003BB4E4A5
MKFIGTTLLLYTALLSEIAVASVVKLSRGGICHGEASPHYDRTKNFQPFLSMDECLAAGGQLPKGQSHFNQKQKTSNYQPSREYRREYFDHWSDDDRDCINTRHELLLEQSTSTIDTGKNKCTVERGRWNDPYTGKIFYNARDLDVDHVIPLYWAWQHGADQWSTERRKQFANDEVNLLAVQGSVNREKGAKGPLEWLPPDNRYHCQYLSRWKRIILKYGLKLSAAEQQRIQWLHSEKCQKQ